MSKFLPRLALLFSVLGQGACTTLAPSPMPGADICREDAQCRHLTTGERKLVKQIFGDALPVDAIEIRMRPIGQIDGMDAFGYVRDEAPLTFNVNSRATWRTDYSASGEDARKFMHEVTHMWQLRRGLDLQALRRELEAKHGHDMSESYHFHLGPTAKFSDFSYEAQAEMVGAYAEYLVGGASLARMIAQDPSDNFGQVQKNRHCTDGAALKRVLAPVIGKRADPFCAVVKP